MLKILTDTGFSEFKGVRKDFKEVVKITFDDNTYITSSTNHRFYDKNMIEIFANQLKINQILTANNKSKKIIHIENLGFKDVFDVIDVKLNNRYYTNDVLSHNCSFAGATGALIASAVLAIIKRKEPINIKELVKKEEPTLRVFEKPIKDHKYIITVDTARGLGLDYSAFVVFDVTKLPYKIVASYRNNLIPTSLYPLHIVNAARDYNSAYLLIEMNDLGFQIAEDIYETYEYDNLFRVFTDKKTKSQKIGWFVDSQLGVKTSVATKKTGCANIKSLIETFKLELNDPIIIDEFSTFVRVGNSYEADDGCNDDFAMCCVLFGWAVGQQHVIEMIESNFKTQMIEDYKEEHSDLLPLAFSVIDGLDEPISNNGYREVTPQMMQDAFFSGF